MSYNSKVDYSEIPGEIILPYTIEHDESNSVFSPQSGKNQKFSYIVTATGHDSGSQAGMDYIVLGVDEKITASQVQEITVEINGSKENVRFEKNNKNNVSLVNPDENTACSGLKFEFALNKTNDIMKISFELSEIYEVGSIPVSLYGGGTAKTGLTIGGPTSKTDTPEPGEKDPEEGENFNFEFEDKFSDKIFDIYVPVSIKPYAHACEPEVTCFGEQKIYTGCRSCDKEFESCEFTIVQKINVKVPVKYGVLTHYGKVCIDEEETDIDSPGEE